MTGEVPPWLVDPWSRFLAALKERRLGHAVLVAGEAGLSKRTLVARMVATLLCHSPDTDGEACNRCRGCLWRKADTHPDRFRVVPGDEGDAIKVDQIRDLGSRLQLTAQAGAVRVAEIDPADRMNGAAQNALLKTLEEPAQGVHLILVSDAPARLLPTVRSRCQALTVTAPGPEAVAAWMQGAGLAPSATACALGAGNPRFLIERAQPERLQHATAVADDLRTLAAGRVSSLAIAKRWTDSAMDHVDDAIAWLRVWSWAANGVTLLDGDRPTVPAPALAGAYRDALRLRERLQGPLKAHWLLHEWLSAWQSATGVAAPTRLRDTGA